MTNQIHSISTFYANVYTGLRKGYAGELIPIETLINLIESFIEAYPAKFGVTVTPANFVYPGGNETGAVIGLINYPRFPTEEIVIKTQATDLAVYLKDHLEQERLTIVMPNETLLIGEK